MAYKNSVGRLRDATLDLHHDAERYVRILDADATPATYTKYLARMYGFHGPVERAFADHVGLIGTGFAPASRTKLALLAIDLGVLGVQADMLPRCTTLPDTQRLACALGVAYVVEGSTLGGTFIRSRLRLDVPVRFLAGYGDDTGSMWRSFCAIADRELGTSDAVDDAVAAARATFSSLIAWLDEPAREPPHPNRALRKRAIA